MAETIEQAPPRTNADFELWERQLGLDRAEQLASIPQEGFTPEQHRRVVDQILAIGLPVDNYAKLIKRPNGPDTEKILASWGAGTENYGEFSVYELLDRQVPEKHLATIAHEGAHANTPFRRENARLFGGEVQRAEAELFAKNLAAQSLVTGKYLTGYHKYLANQLIEGEITLGTFAEETQAIATELALTNRAKLQQVESAQHAKLANLQKAGLLPEDVQPINLLSHTNTNGEVKANGIDKQLIALLDGVSGHEDLVKHVDNLKVQAIFPSLPASKV